MPEASPRVILRRLLLILLMLGCGVAAAREPLPPGVLTLASWRLSGEGEMRWFGLRLYHAELWLGSAQFDPAGPFALRLRYARDFAGERLAQSSVDEMRRAGIRDEVRLKRWQTQLASLFPDVKEGETLLGVSVPGEDARLYHNGRLLGRIEDAELGRAFFDIWLAPGTREPGLRERLIGSSG